MSFPRLAFIFLMIRAAEPSRRSDRVKRGLGHPIEPFASCARLVWLIVGVGSMLSSDYRQGARAVAAWVKILTPPRGKPRLIQLQGPTHFAVGVATTLTRRDL